MFGLLIEEIRFCAEGGGSRASKDARQRAAISKELRHRDSVAGKDTHDVKMREIDALRGKAKMFYRGKGGDMLHRRARKAARLKGHPSRIGVPLE